MDDTAALVGFVVMPRRTLNKGRKDVDDESEVCLRKDHREKSTTP